MKTEIFDTNDELSRKGAELISTTIVNKPNAVICLATGESPLLTYHYLSAFEKERRLDFSQVSFVALDEWVGIPRDNTGSCNYFLEQNVFTKLNLKPSNIHLFDACSASLSSECSKMDQTIAKLGGIDLMLVGIGMNGHIGFNEPGISPDLLSHVIDLDETTTSVGQKYFGERTKLSQGITLGLRHFMNARTALMVANGRKKASIIKRTIEEPVSTQLPSTMIRKHPNGILFLDKEAASLLA